jgi:transcriptional regulator of NAD metabolism
MSIMEEPCVVIKSPNTESYRIFCGNEYIGSIGNSDRTNNENKERAKRIVGCINICRDIPKKILELPNYSVGDELYNLERQIECRLKAEYRVKQLEGLLEEANRLWMQGIEWRSTDDITKAIKKILASDKDVV